MSAMPRTLLTVVALIALTIGAGVIGEALDFNGVAYFGALLVVMLLVSLTDRERFYGPPGTAR
jgi:hypothetical protein